MKTDTLQLGELRARTDKELLTVIKKELKRALLLSSVATRPESAFYQRAERIVEAVSKLLPTISYTSSHERHRLQGGLKEVRSSLDRLVVQRTQHVACSTEDNDTLASGWHFTDLQRGYSGLQPL